MFADKFPAAPAPKFVHIVKFRGAGEFNAHTLCGRRVNFMSTGTEEQATCNRCVAESLARPVAVAAK